MSVDVSVAVTLSNTDTADVDSELLLASLMERLSTRIVAPVCMRWTRNLVQVNDRVIQTASGEEFNLESLAAPPAAESYDGADAATAVVIVLGVVALIVACCIPIIAYLWWKKRGQPKNQEKQQQEKQQDSVPQPFRTVNPILYRDSSVPLAEFAPRTFLRMKNALGCVVFDHFLSLVHISLRRFSFATLPSLISWRLDLLE